MNANHRRCCICGGFYGQRRNSTTGRLHFRWKKAKVRAGGDRHASGRIWSVFGRATEQAGIDTNGTGGKTAAVGAKLKGIDYRSIDMGIVAAYITAEAAAQGLGSCILGWVDDDKIRKACGVTGKVCMVITLGYAKEDDKQRVKKRKDMDQLVTWLDK